jgi:hypothetical protein
MTDKILKVKMADQALAAVTILCELYNTTEFKLSGHAG